MKNTRNSKKAWLVAVLAALLALVMTVSVFAESASVSGDEIDGKASELIAYQVTESDGARFSIRMIAGVSSLTYDACGYEVVVSTTDAEGNVTVATAKGEAGYVYSSIYAGNTKYDIRDFSEYDYASLITLEGIKADAADVKIEIRPYVVADGKTEYCAAGAFNYAGAENEDGYPSISYTSYDGTEIEPDWPIYNADVMLSEEMQQKMSGYLPTKWPAVINTIMDNITDDFMFVVQTDTHYSVATDDAKVGYNIAALSHYLPLSCFMNLGDYIKGYYAGEAGKAENTPELTMQSLKELTRRYLTDLNTKALITYGNHDANQLWCKYYGTADQQLTGADLYENVTSKMVEHNGKDMVTNGESNYYYVDFPKDGVRIIMLNTLDGNYESTFDDTQYISDAQFQWFKNVALNTDYTVIIGAHVPFLQDFPGQSGNAPSVSDKIRAAVNAFEQKGGEFVAYLYGHNHKQENMVDEYGNLHLSFMNGQHNAEVVMVDFENKHITTVGLGSPVAREFDY